MMFFSFFFIVKFTHKICRLQSDNTGLQVKSCEENSGFILHNNNILKAYQPSSMIYLLICWVQMSELSRAVTLLSLSKILIERLGRLNSPFVVVVVPTTCLKIFISLNRKALIAAHPTFQGDFRSTENKCNLVLPQGSPRMKTGAEGHQCKLHSME